MDTDKWFLWRALDNMNLSDFDGLVKIEEWRLIENENLLDLMTIKLRVFNAGTTTLIHETP